MATQPTFEFNASKFRNLLLHLGTMCEEDPRFGATKLNKLLYYIDFGAYRLLGQPVTCATYQNLPEGPAPRELVAVRDALIKEGAAAMEVRPYFIGMQTRLVAKEEPDLRGFSSAERTLIEEVVQEFWHRTAREVSDLSHNEWGWRSTQTYEDIPYHTAWFSTEHLNQNQVEIGKQVAERHRYVA